MPEITFDGRKVSVPDHTNLVEAGLAAGVPVPVFCYHRDLGAVGACRVCAVTATVKGRSRLVMACMTAVADGMEVSTLDADSIEFRRFVLEWMMENHPHDCPICDEGGECQLQDLTIAAGQGHRRFRGRKRTFANQYLGEFIAHEMNRCITCYRCSRFYQEVAGGRDFGAIGSRNRVLFGRFEEGPLESPFSGNLVELCPTGVFTDKLFRYRARVWDLEQTPSICPHCSVGCNLRPGARHRELMRIRVRENAAVNGGFLCDRGQFGFGWVEDPQRPRVVRVRGAGMTWEDALRLAGGELLAIARAHGPEAVGLAASPRAPLEAHAALRDLAAGPLAGARLAHFDDPEREARALAQLAALAAARRPPLEQSDLARCDVLLVAGPSLVDEAPLAALGARDVVRHGGRLLVVNAGEHYLDDVAERLVPTAPAALAGALERLAGADPGGGDLGAIATRLRAARRPGILAGGDLADGRSIAVAGRLAAALGGDARLGYVFPGPNGFGAAALAQRPGLPAWLEALLGGRLRAALLVEADLERLGPAVVRALEALELLIVLDHVPGALEAAAHVRLPATTSYECDGVFVNRAGRAQAFESVLVPGEPVTRMVRGAIFPREPHLRPPFGDVRPSWWALERMREAAGGPPPRDLGRLRLDLARAHPLWRPLAGLEPGTDGAPLDPGLLTVEPPTGPAPEPASLALHSADRTLGSEPLSRRSTPMRAMAGPPVAAVSPEDARRFGLDGLARLECDGQTIEIAVRARATVPAGVVLVPRDAPWSAPPRSGAAVRVTALRPGGSGGGS